LEKGGIEKGMNGRRCRDEGWVGEYEPAEGIQEIRWQMNVKQEGL